MGIFARVQDLNWPFVFDNTIPGLPSNPYKGLRVWGLGFRVQGLGFGVSRFSGNPHYHPILENQMENRMEHEMETGTYIGLYRVYGLGFRV